MRRVTGQRMRTGPLNRVCYSIDSDQAYLVGEPEEEERQHSHTLGRRVSHVDKISTENASVRSTPVVSVD